MIKKFLIFIFLFSNINAQYSLYLDDKVKTAQKELAINYSNLIDSKSIDQSFNVTAKPKKSGFKSEGLKLLELIGILEETQTEQSNIILDKIHNLYYLEFYKLISQLKTNEPEIVFASITLSDLFLPNLKNPDLKTLKIRTILTKTLIQIVIINKALSFHQTKKDAIHFLLDSAKQEILNEKKNVNQKNLNAFFKILEIYTPQALIGKWTKRLLITSTVILAITIIAITTYNNCNIKKWHDSFVNQITKDVNKMSKEAVDEALDTFNNRTKIDSYFLSFKIKGRNPQEEPATQKTKSDKTPWKWGGWFREGGWFRGPKR